MTFLLNPGAAYRLFLSCLITLDAPLYRKVVYARLAKASDGISKRASKKREFKE